MIQINDTLISLDVLEKQFICDLNSCKGACCIHGDSGAPLADEETSILENILDEVIPYLRPEGISAIKDQSAWIIDSDGDKVTPLINGAECAYTYYNEDGACLCAIEKAWLEKKIDFQKPISCHLYPIRIKKYDSFEAMNYHAWDICEGARCLGKKEKIRVYEFLQKPLIRQYGIEWYNELCNCVSELREQNIIS